MTRKNLFFLILSCLFISWGAQALQSGISPADTNNETTDSIADQDSLDALVMQSESSADGAGWSQFLQLPVVPPTPTSAVFSRFDAESPSLSTGAVSLSVPFYTIDYKGVSLPIALKYMSNGVKVFDSPYPCGYGWSLHPALRITRTMHGRPDELFPAATPEDFRQIESKSLEEYNMARMCMLQGASAPLVDGYRDCAHDIFTVHLPDKTYIRIAERGASGILEFNGPSEEIIITPSDKKLSSITVVDSKGVKYVFGASLEKAENDVFPTSWELTEITVPTGQKISLAWKTYPNWVCHREVSGPRTFIDGFPGSWWIPEGVHEGEVRQSNNVTIDSHPCYAVLESISWPAGKAAFSYSAQGMLSSISIFDHNNKERKKCSLQYTADRHYDVRNCPILLGGITLSSGEKYAFEYDNQRFIHDYAQDYWGYYNGRNSNGCLSPEVKIEMYLQGKPHRWDLVEGANREPDSLAMKACILTKVTYPTGGYSIFEYEPHKFDDPGVHYAYEIEENYNRPLTWGGGLRLARTVTSAGDGSPQLVRTYRYGGSTGKAVCTNVPSLSTFVTTTKSIMYDPKNSRCVEHRRVSVNPFSNYNSASFGQPVLWYDTVAEVTSNSKKIYEFGLLTGFDNPRGGGSLSAAVPYDAYASSSSGPVLLSETRLAYRSGKWEKTRRTEHEYHAHELRISDTHIARNFTSPTGPYMPDFPDGILNNGLLLDHPYEWNPKTIYEVAPYTVTLSSSPVVDATTTVVYSENGDSIQTKEWSEYLQGTDIVQKRSVSDGYERRSRFYGYPGNWSKTGLIISSGEIPGVYTSMKQLNMIAVPVAIADSAGDEGGIHSLVQTIFNKTAGTYLPLSIIVKRDGSSAVMARYSYDGAGNMITANIKGQLQKQLQWDATGQYLQKLTEGGKFSTQFEYVPLVGLSSRTNPGGVKETFEYDAKGRLVKSSVTGLGTVAEYEYGMVCDDDETNYVRTASWLDAAGSQKTYSRTVYDGLGRPWLSVSEGIAASLTEYDSQGRACMEWQPVPCSAEDFITASAFKLASKNYYGNNSYAFTSKGFGLRQEQQPDSMRRPGSYLQTHASPITSHLYASKTSGKLSCTDFRVDSQGRLCKKGTMASGRLTVQSTVNEDGDERLVFTNAFGQKILERAVLNEASGKWADTYYVYDACGRLRYMLSPECVAALAASGKTLWDFDEEITNFGYYYEYNLGGTPIIKLLPGRAPIETLCDADYLPVLWRDGNQSDRGAWSFCIRDSLLRPALEGEVIVSDERAQAIAKSNPKASRQPSSATYVVPGASECVECADIVTFYDSHDFLASIDNADAYRGNALSQSASKGQVTGRIVSGLLSVTFHDSFGRVVQMSEMNHSGKIDKTVISLRHDGQPSSKVLTHSHPKYTDMTETYAYAYDAHGRQTSIIHKIDNGTGRIISSTTYNSIGKVASASPGGNLPVSYSYDANGRLRSISSVPFKQNLNYEGAGASTSGAINILTNQFGGESSTSVSYLYDRLGRLVTVKMPANSAMLAQYAYDLNCNLKSIKRWGVYDRVDGSIEEGVIDDISLEHYGNMIIRAHDAADALNYSGANDLAAGDAEFNWDSNGNMISDSSRGIESIEYNRLNQPVRIAMDRGKLSVTFMYDASGVKLAEIDTVPIGIVGPIGPDKPVIPIVKSVSPFFPQIPLSVDRTDYYGNKVYVNGVLKRVMFPGGYATPRSSGSGYDYHYFICDYQGNVRAVVGEAGNIEEKNSYYPYGMLMPAEADGDLPAKQPYKWSGKEYLTIHGINLYDFGPRALFSPLCAFTQPDPLCESNPAVSPYVYCSGNPVGRIDPSGLSDYFNLNGEWVYTIDDEINKSYVVITESNDEDEVKKHVAEGNFILAPSKEILGKMSEMLDLTLANALEYLMVVNDEGESSEVEEGTPKGVTGKQVADAIEKVGGKKAYDAHTHPLTSVPDENGNYDGTHAPSEDDCDSSNPGETNVILGFVYGRDKNFNLIKDPYILFYNRGGQVGDLQPFTKFTNAMKRVPGRVTSASKNPND